MCLVYSCFALFLVLHRSLYSLASLLKIILSEVKKQRILSFCSYLRIMLLVILFFSPQMKYI